MTQPLKEDYRAKAVRIARVLKDRLSEEAEEEFRELLDISGDYTNRPVALQRAAG